MKTKRIFAALLLPALLLLLFSCGKQAGKSEKEADPLEGPVENFDGRYGNECFFGSIEELRGLYDAIRGGDEAVKEFVARRETEKEYLDDLPFVDSAAKARYLLKDTLDLPIAVFPEEEIVSTYFTREAIATEIPPGGGSWREEGGTQFRVQYNLDENRHYRDENFILVTVNYNLSQQFLENFQAAFSIQLIETVEISGQEMQVYMTSRSVDDTENPGNKKIVYSVSGSILTDGAEVRILMPPAENAKEAVERLHKVRMVPFCSFLGLDGART